MKLNGCICCLIPENWRKLEAIYDDIDDVDLFAGGFMETQGAGCTGKLFSETLSYRVAGK